MGEKVSRRSLGSGSQINVRCTKKIREMVRVRVNEFGFTSEAEYVRHLVVNDFRESRKGKQSDAETAE